MNGFTISITAAERGRYSRPAGTLAQKIRDTAGVAGWRATMGRGWRELEAAS